LSNDLDSSGVYHLTTSEKWEEREVYLMKNIAVYTSGDRVPPYSYMIMLILYLKAISCEELVIGNSCPSWPYTTEIAPLDTDSSRGFRQVCGIISYHDICKEDREFRFSTKGLFGLLDPLSPNEIDVMARNYIKTINISGIVKKLNMPKSVRSSFINGSVPLSIVLIAKLMVYKGIHPFSYLSKNIDCVPLPCSPVPNIIDKKLKYKLMVQFWIDEMLDQEDPSKCKTPIKKKKKRMIFKDSKGTEVIHFSDDIYSKIVKGVTGDKPSTYVVNEGKDIVIIDETKKEVTNNPSLFLAKINSKLLILNIVKPPANTLHIDYDNLRYEHLGSDKINESDITVIGKIIWRGGLI